MPKPKELTTAQRVVIAYYAVHRAGAMKYRGRWLWLKEIQANPQLAEDFIRDRSDEGYRDNELLRAWLASPQGRVQ